MSVRRIRASLFKGQLSGSNFARFRRKVAERCGGIFDCPEQVAGLGFDHGGEGFSRLVLCLAGDGNADTKKSVSFRGCPLSGLVGKAGKVVGSR